jgi:outer membrane immunogenic protein
VKTRLLSSAAALTLLDVSGAAAQPPPPPIMTWTGFYVGGHVGYGWGDISTDRADIRTPTGMGFSSPGVLVFSLDRGLRPEGVSGGGQFGYNYQNGSVVFGFETDISWTSQSNDFSFRGAKFITSEDYVYQETLRAKLEYMGTVRGRLGYAFGQFLPYVTGGFAWGHTTTDFNSTLHQLFGGTQTIASSQSNTLTGWALGGGFEYAFARQWSAKAEYLFVDLGRADFLPGQTGGSFGLQDHIVRIGFNFRM